MQEATSRTGEGGIAEQVKALGPWFHNLHLPGGVQTAPHHPFGDFPSFKWKDLQGSIPENLEGWSALDIGCNAGFYTFELAKRGANVLGIDLDPHYLKQAQWAAQQLGLEHKTEFRQMQVYDLAHLDQRFDLIIFMGVFYHLRYPVLALDIVTQKLDKLLVFQTLTMPGEEVYPAPPDMSMDDRQAMLEAGWPKMAFIEHKLAGDVTNWWAPNHAGIEALLRTCGLNIISHPGHEMYLAEPAPDRKSVVNGWNGSEYLSAIGQNWSDAAKAKVEHKPLER